jgi:serine/threonine protein kinase
MLEQELAGRYTIGKAVAKGGFSTVYQATDKVLQREVAIKIITANETLADGQTPPPIISLLDEARFIARHRHPHILDVYDFGQFGNSAYIVMPFAGQGTLWQKIRREGALPFFQTEKYLEQIASALDYAHSLGVVHRDIKPQNVVIFDNGQVAISDFGIARVVQDNQFIVTSVSGTPSYMAPEQLEGKVSAASDIYSLTVVLYQMLTGEVPFKAPNQVDLREMILKSPPPGVRRLRPEAPIALDNLIKRGMSKDPAERPSSAQELLQEYRLAVSSAIDFDDVPTYIPSNLAGIREVNYSVQVVDTDKKERGVWFGLTVGVGSFIALALVVALLILVLNRPPSNTNPTPVQVAANTVTATARPISTAPAPTLTPTGTVINTVTPLPNPSVAVAPATVLPKPSPISVGGKPLSGKIAFNAAEGGSTVVKALYLDDLSEEPLFSIPGGAENPIWSSEGKLLYTQNRVLVVADEDGRNPQRLGVSGTNPAWSPDGKQIVYVGSDNEIYRVAANGQNATKLTAEGSNTLAPVFSPDGREIAFSRLTNSVWQLWVMNSDGTNQRQLTFQNRNARFPTWSPAGKQIAFHTSDANLSPIQIWVINVNGTGLKALTGEDGNGRPYWAGNNFIFFHSYRNNKTKSDLYVMSAEGSSQTRLTQNSPDYYGVVWKN